MKDERIKPHPEKLVDSKSSGGIVEVASIYSLAVAVLGSDDATGEWMNTEAIGLGFRKPIDLISVDSGFAVVKTLLQRMQYGVYA